MTLSLFFIAIPTRYNELQHTCTPGQCNQSQLTPADIPALEQSGFSLRSYATYNIIAVLALIYFGLVIALQFIVSSIFGHVHSKGDLLWSPDIVISTLTIAALFQPLRYNIQKGIDRRFYRSKYEAVETFEAFSATLSSETDLNELSEQLVAVIQETMRPAGAALWLFQPERDETSKTRIFPEIGDYVYTDVHASYDR